MKDREMSREEAIKRLEEGAPFSELYDSRWEDALALAIKALKAEPVRHGRWENYLAEGLRWECSECGSRFEAPYHYCPNCGARMDEEGE